MRRVAQGSIPQTADPKARPPADTALSIDADVRTSLMTQLRRVQGQVEGLQRMLTGGRDCAEIAQQVAAARAALDRVAIDLIAAGLERCIELEGQGEPHAGKARAKLKKTFLMLR